MQPLIGITATVENGKLALDDDMMFAILQAGGIPVALPQTGGDDSLAAACLERLDGLLVSGGVDVDPLLYGEEPMQGLGSILPDRDRTEQSYIRSALGRDQPILAICRGAQMLNVTAGGSLYQDIYAQLEGVLLHSQKAPRSHRSHFVDIERESMLYRIVGAERLPVNSFHHQAVKALAPCFIRTASASDGILEAYESTEHTFVVGVQWHPENLARSDPAAQQLFAGFVQACRSYGEGSC